MAKLQLTVNGSKVEKNQATLEFLKSVMTTENPAAKGVAGVLADVLAETPAYFAIFSKTYKTADVLEISVLEDVTENNVTKSIIKPAAKYAAGNLLKKLQVAADSESWKGEIFTEKSEKKSTDKGSVTA